MVNDLQREKRNIGRMIHQIDMKLGLHRRNSPERKELMQQKVVLLAQHGALKERLAGPVDSGVISDHALVRWLERKHGIDTRRLKEIMFTDSLSMAINDGLGYYSDGEVVYVIKDGAVQTVIRVENK